MKPRDITWPDYLLQGVERMEGVYNYASTQDYLTAAEIFEQCACQAENVSVSVEATLRRAQCARYQRDFTTERAWHLQGSLALREHYEQLSQDTVAQCRLLRSIINEGESVQSYEELYAMTTDAKIRADIANRLGGVHLKLQQTKDALHWFAVALDNLEDIRDWCPTNLARHAEIAVIGKVGSLRQRFYGYRDDAALRIFTIAEENLIKHIQEPGVWAQYWRNRSVAAFKCWRLINSTRFYFAYFLYGWRYKMDQSLTT